MVLTLLCKAIRPDLIKVLFLISSPYAFQRVKRIKVKTKTGKIMHENTFLEKLFI